MSNTKHACFYMYLNDLMYNLLVTKSKSKTLLFEFVIVLSFLFLFFFICSISIFNAANFDVFNVNIGKIFVNLRPKAMVVGN